MHQCLFQCHRRKERLACWTVFLWVFFWCCVSPTLARPWSPRRGLDRQQASFSSHSTVPTASSAVPSSSPLSSPSSFISVPASPTSTPIATPPPPPPTQTPSDLATTTPSVPFAPPSSSSSSSSPTPLPVPSFSWPPSATSPLPSEQQQQQHQCTRTVGGWLDAVSQWPGGEATYALSLCGRSWHAILLASTTTAESGPSVNEEGDASTLSADGKSDAMRVCLPLAAEWVAANLSVWHHVFSSADDDTRLYSHLDGALLLVDACCDEHGSSDQVNLNALHTATLTMRDFNHGRWDDWPACPELPHDGGNGTHLSNGTRPPGSDTLSPTPSLLSGWATWWWDVSWYKGPYRRFFYSDESRRILSGGGLALLLILLFATLAILAALLVFKRYQVEARRRHRQIAIRLLQRFHGVGNEQQHTPSHHRTTERV